MTLRVAVAGIHHESNTFAPQPADLSTFEDGGIQRREEIRDKYADSNFTLAGFLELDSEADVEVDPILFASVSPSGPVTESAYRVLADECGGELDRGNWDAVLLAQHGAAVGESTTDLDSDFLRIVRGRSRGVPLGVTIDMHANVSPDVVDQSDVLVAYQTNPHVDPRVRARHCADLLLATVNAEIHPVTALVQIPLALHIAVQDTDTAPMADLLLLTREAEKDFDLLSASLVEGFPYADVPQMGMSVIAIADGSSSEAAEAATGIGEAVWHIREDLTAQLPSPAEAIGQAASTVAPTLVLDVGDNIGGGSTGDSTVLLREARHLGVSGVFQTICDPESVKACFAATFGSKMRLKLGGKSAGSPAPPMSVTGKVTATSDGRYEDATPTHGGFRYFNAGPCAVFETDEGNTILLTSRIVQNTSLQQLAHIGLDHQSFSIIVGKGVNAPKAAYRPVVDRMIHADTPGITTANLHSLNYKRRRRCFPFENWDWQPRPHVGSRVGAAK